MPDINPSQIEAKLNKISEDVRNAISASNEEVQKHGKIGKKNQASIDTIENSIQEVTARVLELEQLGTGQNDVENAIKSVGAQFADSDAFSGYVEGTTTKAKFDAAENNAVVGSNATVAPDRREGVVGASLRKLRVLDTVPRGVTGSNSIEYTRELLVTNGAAETEEGPGSGYPESTITFELATAPVRNIGTFIYLSKQILDDAPAIASYIDGRLTYMVEYRKDSQILIGNGAGQNISGITAGGNHTVYSPGVDSHGLENIRLAIAKVESADYSATAVYLNPLDCAAMDLLTSQTGEFLSANPRLQSVKTVWGLPVIETNAVPAGKFVVGAMDMACQFTERSGTVVEMSDSDGDNFTKDMVTLKASARGALEIYRPASIVVGNLTGPSS